MYIYTLLLYVSTILISTCFTQTLWPTEPSSWIFEPTKQRTRNALGWKERDLKALKQKKQQLVGGLKHISQMFNMFSKVEPGKMLGTRTIEKKHLFELQVRPTPKGRSFTHRPPFKFSVAENLVSNLGSSCRGHLFDTKPCNNALWRIRSPPKNMHTFA